MSSLPRIDPEFYYPDKAQYPGCKDCPRFSCKIVPYEIRAGAGIAILGEAPGEREASVERPFVGPAGRVLERLLGESGLSRDSVSILNTVPCFVDGNPKPTVDEIKCCAPVLESAIAKAAPNLIVAMGEVAVSRLIGPRKIFTWRGSILRRPQLVEVGVGTSYVEQPSPGLYKAGPKKGTPKPAPKPKKIKTPITIEQSPTIDVLITEHPAALIYTGFAAWPLVVADLRRARHSLQPTFQAPAERWIPSATPETLRHLLESQKAVVLDVETDGRVGPLTLVGLAANPEYVINFRPSTPHLELLSNWMNDPTNLFIGHNVAYDRLVLEHVGVPVRAQLWDTMHAAHFERPDLLKGLEDVASRIPGWRYHNWKADFKARSQPALDLYNALDCGWTAVLYEQLHKSLAHTNRLRHFNEVIMPLVPILSELEQRGVLIDTAKFEDLYERQQEAVQMLQEAWEAVAPNIDPNSPPQLLSYFYGTLGLPPILDPDTKRPTTAKGALEELAAIYPTRTELQLLISLRHTQKILSTYLNPAHIRAGRLHPSYNISGTTTGRLSGGGESEGINFQVLPRTKGTCPNHVELCQCGNIRQLFLPDSGRVAVGDWSQIEFRISAMLAGEKQLIEAYKSPSFSIHKEVAKRLCISYDLAKRGVHGTNFGMGAAKFARSLGVDLRTAHTFIDNFRGLYPYLARWRTLLVSHAREYGWVANPFTRRGYFRIGKKGTVDPPKVIAFVPQSTAADMMLVAISRAHQMGLTLLWTVHDELGVEAPTDEAAITLKAVMESDYTFEDVPWNCPAEVGIGPNWASAKH